MRGGGGGGGGGGATVAWLKHHLAQRENITPNYGITKLAKNSACIQTAEDVEYCMGHTGCAALVKLGSRRYCTHS